MVSCPKYAPLDFRLRSTDLLACCNQLVVRGATINARKTDKQSMTNFRWYKVAAEISPFFFWTKLKLTGRITLISGTTSCDIDQLATTTVPSSDKVCSVQRLGDELTDRWPNFCLQACLKVRVSPVLKSP